MPGDGRGPIHEKTREWARKFYDGDPDYQDDDIWWRAVLAHEQLKDAAMAARAANLPAGQPESEPCWRR